MWSREWDLTWSFFYSARCYWNGFWNAEHDTGLGLESSLLWDRISFHIDPSSLIRKSLFDVRNERKSIIHRNRNNLCARKRVLNIDLSYFLPVLDADNDPMYHSQHERHGGPSVSIHSKSIHHCLSTREKRPEAEHYVHQTITLRCTASWHGQQSWSIPTR